MTLYFYDLETSGFNPRSARIMQFAGQRTDLDLNPVGDADNILIKLTPDVLPEPDAVLVTGITPQKTLSEGISETEFVDYLTNKVFLADTIMVGYNNIRFDDEFIRFTLWRNFSDAYEWQWKDGCSKWDLLDVVRMTRALRPDGIKWPFAPDGKPTVRLEYMSSVNKLEHTDAHDALSDVNAAIAIAKLIKQTQPKLYDYLFNNRDKRSIAALVERAEPLIYTSGRYPSEYEKTTVAVMVGKMPDGRGALMYDLRSDPNEIKNLSVTELAERIKARRGDAPPFPVKRLIYNRCPAVAPLSVLDTASSSRLGLDKKTIETNRSRLSENTELGQKLVEAFEEAGSSWQTEIDIDDQKVDEQLYDKFIGSNDKTKMLVVRAAGGDKLASLSANFEDGRLNALLPLYKARNFPTFLTAGEKNRWRGFCAKKLFQNDFNSPSAKYFRRIEELLASPGLKNNEKALLKELESYGRSILPAAEVFSTRT